MLRQGRYFSVLKGLPKPFFIFVFSRVLWFPNLHDSLYLNYNKMGIVIREFPKYERRGAISLRT